jgi:hypothetical protein
MKYIYLFAGLFFLLCGIIMLLSAKKHKDKLTVWWSTAQKTTGVVIGYVESKDYVSPFRGRFLTSKALFYSPILRYQINGISYESNSQNYHTSQRFEINSTVNIAYQDNAPTDIKLVLKEHNDDTPSWPTSMLLQGFALIAIGLFMLFKFANCFKV